MNVMYLELWNARNLCCNTRRIEDKGLKRVGRQSSNTEILTLVEDGSWRWFRLENFQVISGPKGNTSRKEASKITQEMFFNIFLQVTVLLQELGNNNFVSCNLKCPSVDPSKGMESSWKAAGMPGIRRFAICIQYTYIYIYAWNPKQPDFYGCFNWMMPNLYLGNGCLTKHPFKNGCLGYQVCIYTYPFGLFLNTSSRGKRWCFFFTTSFVMFKLRRGYSSQTQQNINLWFMEGWSDPEWQIITTKPLTKTIWLEYPTNIASFQVAGKMIFSFSIGWDIWAPIRGYSDGSNKSKWAKSWGQMMKRITNVIKLFLRNIQSKAFKMIYCLYIYIFVQQMFEL